MIKYEVKCTKRLCNHPGPWYGNTLPQAECIKSMHEMNEPNHWVWITVNGVDIAEEIKA